MSEEKKDWATELGALVDLTNDFQRRFPELTQEKLTEKGGYIFSAQALAEKNVKNWCEIQQLELKREELALRRAKLELETAGAREGKAEVTEEEGEAKVKQIFGI